MLVKKKHIFLYFENGNRETYRIVVALSLEAVEHHGLAAAAGGRPRRTDEHPDEGIRRGRVQALCQAEEVGGLATAHVRSPLVAQQRWWRENEATVRICNHS